MLYQHSIFALINPVCGLNIYKFSFIEIGVCVFRDLLVHLYALTPLAFHRLQCGTYLLRERLPRLLDLCYVIRSLLSGRKHDCTIRIRFC